MRRLDPMLLAFAFCLVASPGWAAAPPMLARVDPRHPPSRMEIDKLIKQLGSDEFTARDDATRRLMQIEASAPALRQALTSPDAEVGHRARRILTSLERKRHGRVLEAMKADERAGRADLLAERIVRWDGSNDEPGVWQPMLQLCHRILEFNEDWMKERSKKRALPPLSFLRYVEVNKPKFPAPRVPELSLSERNDPSRVVARSEKITVKGLVAGSLLAAADLVRLPDKYASNCFVLAGGSVEVNFVVNSVIHCAGDFEAQNLAWSVVVVRGDVHLERGIEDCVILAGGDVTISNTAGLANCRIRACGKITGLPRDAANCDIKANAPNALSCVRFFQTTDTGLDVAANKAGLRATAVEAGPFAKAGLKVGDVLLAFDGKDLDKADAFRRLLRRRVVEGGECPLRIRRQDKTLTLIVAFD